MPGMKMFYTVYEKGTEALVTCGTSSEVADFLGISKNTLYKYIIRRRKGESCPYAFYRSPLVDEEYRELLCEQGNELRKARVQYGLTQRQLGLLTHYATSTICGYEHGRSRFDLQEFLNAMKQED